MKYGSYIIVSLLDFRRYFSWKNFFASREQFVRDMNPAKVYYWNEELKSAYKQICDWITSGRISAAQDICPEMLRAFTILLGYEPKLSNSVEEKIYDFTLPIIAIETSDDIIFPANDKVFKDSEILLHLHKIKIKENSEGRSSVSLGGKCICELEPGEVVYVTEIKGKFVEFLENHSENQFFSAQLIDDIHSMGSTLVITDKRTGVKQQISHVVSFVLADKGYLYITDTGNLVSIENDLPVFLLREHNTKALQVKRFGDIIKVLYENGICRSTDSLQPSKGVIKLTN